MKKLIMILFLIVAMLLCTGCKEKEEVRMSVLSDPNETIITETIITETIITETILGENVLTERWP